MKSGERWGLGGTASACAVDSRLDEYTERKSIGSCRFVLVFRAAAFDPPRRKRESDCGLSLLLVVCGLSMRAITSLMGGYRLVSESLGWAGAGGRMSKPGNSKYLKAC